MGTWRNGTLQCLIGELGNTSTVLPEHPQTTHHSTSVLPVLRVVWEWMEEVNPVLWEAATGQLSSGEMLFSQGVSEPPKECDTGSCASPAFTI